MEDTQGALKQEKSGRRDEVNQLKEQIAAVRKEKSEVEQAALVTVLRLSGAKLRLGDRNSSAP